MASPFHVVVCGGPVPDPLQTLEPMDTSEGPGLRNEATLPSILDPFAAHALYEGAHFITGKPDSRLWLVSLGPRTRLQQLMMSVAQKVPFELVAVNGPAGGFLDAHDTAAALAQAIQAVAELDRSRLLLFGGCSSACRDAGTTLTLVGERLGIREQFTGVDRLTLEGDGSLRILERIEGGRHQVSRCDGPPAALSWATGHLAEPPNNPQIGMRNMRTLLPAIQKALPFAPGRDIAYHGVSLPPSRRETRIVRDQPVDAIAAELASWIREA